MLSRLIAALTVAIGIIGGLLFFWAILDFIHKDKKEGGQGG